MNLLLYMPSWVCVVGQTRCWVLEEQAHDLCGCGCFSGVFRPCMLRQWLLVVGVGVWVLLCKWIVDASIWGNTIVFLLL